MILLVDNFDSFTYNLYQYLEECGAPTVVRRTSEVTVDDMLTGGWTGIVISPGPNSPDESGVSLQCILPVSGRVPLLGVCLGHQCMVQAFGGRVVAAPDIRARAQREHFGQQRGLAGQLASRQRERRPQPGRDVDVRLAEYSGSACRSSDTRVSRTATFSCAWRAIARACCT